MYLSICILQPPSICRQQVSGLCLSSSLELELSSLVTLPSLVYVRTSYEKRGNVSTDFGEIKVLPEVLTVILLAVVYVFFLVKKFDILSLVMLFGESARDFKRAENLGLQLLSVE